MRMVSEMGDVCTKCVLIVVVQSCVLFSLFVESSCESEIRDNKEYM
jgi:hypothetical protein